MHWTLAVLDPKPADRVLEIGCGHGAAATLLCEQLESGSLVALDRSAKMVAAASKRNAGWVEAGRAAFIEGSFEDVDLGSQRFDRAFAVNLALFWKRPGRAVPVLARLLAPGAVACFLWQGPPGSPPPAADSAQALVAALEAAGFAAPEILPRHDAEVSGIAVRASMSRP